MFKSFLALGLLFSMSNLFAAASVCILTRDDQAVNINLACDGTDGWLDKSPSAITTALKSKLDAGYSIINVSAVGHKLHYTLLKY